MIDKYSNLSVCLDLQWVLQNHGGLPWFYKSYSLELEQNDDTKVETYKKRNMDVASMCVNVYVVSCMFKKL